MDKQQYHAVGKIYERKDGVAKVTGQEVFASDVVIPRMLYGRVLKKPLSPCIHQKYRYKCCRENGSHLHYR